MGRRNTSSESICRSLDDQSRSRALIQTEQLPCLVLIEYSWTDRFVGEALSDQLIRWCCIDQLSWHDLPGKRSVDDNVSVDGGSSISREPPRRSSQAKYV